MTTPSSGQQLMEDQLTATPDLGGFFLIGGWPLFADTAGMTQFLAATAAGTLKCVAWDTLSMQLPLLENGTVQGLIGQKYFGWGYDGIGIMYDHVVHGIAAAAVHRLRASTCSRPRSRPRSSPRSGRPRTSCPRVARPSATATRRSTSRPADFPLSRSWTGRAATRRRCRRGDPAASSISWPILAVMAESDS